MKQRKHRVDHIQIDLQASVDGLWAGESERAPGYTEKVFWASFSNGPVRTSMVIWTTLPIVAVGSRSSGKWLLYSGGIGLRPLLVEGARNGILH